MGGAVLETPDLRSTGRLERMVDSRDGGTQSLRKRHHQSRPHRSLVGVSTKTGLFRASINERTRRRKDHHRPSETSPSQGSNQSMGGETAGSETSRWRQSLARRQESETPLSEPETSPKTLWTLQNQSSHLPSGVSIRPSPIMDNT